jgi:hypothetical protein
MMSGGYQNFWQTAGNTFSPQAQQEGRRLLDQLFGSDEVSRRVAHQAADYAGISVDTMQQLLPLLAGVLAGGMSQWMAAQAQAMQAFTSPDHSKSNQAATNPWLDLWAGWMKPEKKAATNPFEEMMAPFLQTPPSAKPSPAQASQPSSAWEEMMEQGREMQSQYLASLQSIFEEVWKVAPKKD